MSRQHLFRSCLGLTLFVGCLSGCVPPLTPSSTYTPPSHGNQYYSRQAAKFLGSDNVDSVSYRLIDSVTFENILHTCNSLTSTRATRTLLDSSCSITVDSAQIQAELQLIRDSSLVFKVEYQMYIFINRNTGVISCVRDRPGNNTKSPIEVISSQYYGVTYPKVGNEPPDMRILIAQVHGHPAILDERRKTISSMSDADQLASHCLQVPIYAVDAMNGEIGEPGHIHRANPNPGPDVSTQDLYIGETWRTKRANTSLTINLGLDALRIWGKSQAPDFKCIADWNKAILSKESSTHDLGVIRPLAP